MYVRMACIILQAAPTRKDQLMERESVCLAGLVRVVVNYTMTTADCSHEQHGFLLEASMRPSLSILAWCAWWSMHKAVWRATRCKLLRSNNFTESL